MANGNGARLRFRTHTASHRIPVWSREAAVLKELESSRISLPPVIVQAEKSVAVQPHLSRLAYRDERKPARNPRGYWRPRIG